MMRFLILVLFAACSTTDLDPLPRTLPKGSSQKAHDLCFSEGGVKAVHMGPSVVATCVNGKTFNL